MKKIVISLFLATGIMFTGCATRGGYTTADANTYKVLKEGIILSVKNVTLQDNGGGTLLGAGIGGILGHQVGGGSGKIATTIAGAVLGGIAGKQINQKKGSELLIKLDSGNLIKATLFDYSFRKGDRVIIEFKRGKIYRIRRL